MIRTDRWDATEVRAVAFDAVGTLLHPRPAVAEVYADVGRRFGSRLSGEVVRGRFRAAFAAEEARDEANAGKISAERERARWRAIVAAVLDDVEDAEGCFAALYEHFARPTAWACAPDLGPLLEHLARHYRLALASNFDHRLRPVVAGLPELRPLETLVISSEVGWRKPAPEFFAALGEALALPLDRILLVGDDRGNDFEGARRAGMPTLLLDPHGKHRDLGDRCIANLQELRPRLLGSA